MTISVRLDPERRRAWYAVVGAVSGNEVMADSIEQHRVNPELKTYDIICDLTQYTGDVTAYDMEAVANEANKHWPRNGRRARTAFVTTDRAFRLWVRVMNHQFHGREFEVFDTFEEAEAWLAARRAADKADEPPSAV